MHDDRERDGRKIRPGNTKNMSLIDTFDVTEAVSDALKRAIGDDRNATKKLARIANTSQATARNWLEGKNAPGLAHFIRVCRAIPSLKGVALRLLEADDALDPEFAKKFNDVAQAWLDYQARRR